jgi:hypothetical protein
LQTPPPPERPKSPSTEGNDVVEPREEMFPMVPNADTVNAMGKKPRYMKMSLERRMTPAKMKRVFGTFGCIHEMRQTEDMKEMEIFGTELD